MYLRDSGKKAAVAKFDSTDDDAPGGASLHASTTPGKVMLVVPYDLPPMPTGKLPAGVDEGRLRDENLLRKKGEAADDAAKIKIMQQQQQQKQKMMQQQKLQQQQKQQNIVQQRKAQQSSQKHATPPELQQRPSKNGGGGGKGGLLGNLLGAQRRTGNHLHVVRSQKKSANDMSNFDPTAGVAGVINGFRDRTTAKLKEFKADDTTHVTKVEIDLPSLVRSVPPDEVERATMDAFKFAVYEVVEDVGDDKWVAHREPSEFVDECAISIYKEGHFPPEVLEDVNRAEFPDEVMGAAKHVVESQSRAVQRRGKAGEGNYWKKKDASASKSAHTVFILVADRESEEQCGSIIAALRSYQHY